MESDKDEIDEDPVADDYVLDAGKEKKKRQD